MDEESFLKVLRTEPDNEDVRQAYCEWLEQAGDSRTEYVRLMRRRMRLETARHDLDARLDRWAEKRDNSEWLDIIFPLRVRSTLVGRCYLRLAPESPPFIEVGSRICPGTVVCLVESMKIFNEITADAHGVVSEIAVTDGAPVEYNQVLFRIRRLSWDDWYAGWSVPDSKSPPPTWSVWRQDDNGNRFRMERRLNQVEALEIVRHYESLGHKQLYWAEPEQFA